MANQTYGAIKLSDANAVGSILVKKMGGSGYAPKDWADTINLMGKLPEKTVSGGVANFSDGANDVPVKEAKFYFLPKQASGIPSPSSPLAIDGWTGLTAYRQKKNLIKPDKYQTASNHLTLGQNNGTSFDTFLKAGTYTISYTTSGETCYIYRREENDSSNTNMRKQLSATFTLESEGHFRFWLYGDGAVSSNISNVQIEVGSTATAYEAYQAPTSYPVTWQDSAGALYGGYVDAVRGKVVKTHFLVTLNVSDMDNSDSYPGWKNSGIKQFVDAQDIVLDDAKTTIGDGIGINTTGTKDILYLPKALHNNLSQTQWQTNYPDLEITIAVPYKESSYTEYDIVAFTPNTYYGSNNFYNDCGDSEVTYRRDITLALQESGT